MLGSPAGGPGAAGGHRAPTTSLWPPPPLSSHHVHQQLPPQSHIGASAICSSAEAFSRYGGLYSVVPGGVGGPAGAFYSHAAGALGRFAPTTAYHAHHKLTESTGCYTFGAPTPPPGSPYSPLPVAHLELLAKSFNNNSIIIQQPDYSTQTTFTNTTTSINNNCNLSTNNNHIIQTRKDELNSKRIIEEQQKRWDRNPLLPLSVKTENLSSAKRTCGCRNNNNNSHHQHQHHQHSSPVKSKLIVDGGCSRTNPVSWTPSSIVHVKREPACQVAEVTTSNNTIAATIVKVEAASPNKPENSLVQTSTMSSITTCTTGNGTIPVGIAVARQRLQHELAPSFQTHQTAGGLLTTAMNGPLGQIKEIDSAAAVATAMTVGVTNGGGSIIQCGDDRTNSIASWPLPPTHNSSLTTPTLWQYPAPVPIEPILPMPLPIPPVGFQLVRDPTTGQFLLIPATSFDQLQQAVVWPSYPQTSSHVLLPPLPPPPLAPLQLLGSAASDYLTTASTTLHQHTQTHSTRLVALTTDNKRKLPLPAHTLIKIESDCATPDHTTKTLQTVSTMATNSGAAMFADQSGMTPLLTTHVFYQHPTNLIQISQPTVAAEAICRSQATSPVACLTPPPEATLQSEPEDTLPGVQDASNQTDTPLCSEDDNTAHQLSELDTPCPPSPIHELPPAPPVQPPPVPDVIQPPKLHHVPSASIICTQPADVQISAAITTTQITEVRPCIPISISMTHLTEPKPTARIVEIVEPESSTTDVPLTPIDHPITATIGEPEVTTTTISTINTKPDLSGLELLSNSIVEFENYRKNYDGTTVKVEKEDYETICKEATRDEVVTKIAHMSIKDSDVPAQDKPVTVSVKAIPEEVCQQDDELGGLGLLCALAEQRIMEEVTEKTNIVATKNPVDEPKRVMIEPKIGEQKKLKRCLEERYSLEGRTKKFKVGDFEFERKADVCNKVLEPVRIQCMPEVTTVVNGKDCDKTMSVRNNTFKESPEPNKPIATEVVDRKPYCSNNEWLHMNALERDMRLRLAELERQCNEKQLELNNLTPKKEYPENCLKKMFKRLKTKCEAPFVDVKITPSKVDKIETPPTTHRPADILKPSVLTSKCEYFTKIPDEKVENVETKKRKLSQLQEPSEIVPLEKISSSKKRKVGRPKKFSTPDLCEATETIVAKKPKSLVGYLLAAKSRLHSQSKHSSSSSPPRYHIEDSPSPKPKSSSSHKKKSSSLSKSSKKKSDKKHDKHNSSKIRPKLKAEAKIKLFCDEEDISAHDWVSDSVKETVTVKQSGKDGERGPPKGGCGGVTVEEKQPAKKDVRCVLTAEHLEVEKLRVLTSMGGLFYAGVLSAIRAPDVYAITLDGERGNRPHFMSREEILRDAIVEVSPTTTQELEAGTRLCAYWSQQYRCLYPGTVADPGTPDPILDHRFVSVEFDDGDSGRIALEDIRLLQPDYPIVEYDPNPLLSLSKRKRQCSVNSGGEERRLSVTSVPALGESHCKLQDPKQDATVPKEGRSSKKHREGHKERKKLKKHRRDKEGLVRSSEEKRRKKKHRCTKCGEESCKHRRHHKKHRKHKKHHRSSKERSEETTTTDTCKEEDSAELDEASCELVIPAPAPTQIRSTSMIPEQVKIKYSNNVVLKPKTIPPVEEISTVIEQPEEKDTSVSAATETEESDGDESMEEFPKKSKKRRDRQESVESRSKIAAFLPARQLWAWSGKGHKRPGAKGSRNRKLHYQAIQRGKETIKVGDAAVFLSTGRPDRPYIGSIVSMWETTANSMVVKVKWFYHPEETEGDDIQLKYPGALFASPHEDENDVQTISHKCEVLPLKEYTERLGSDPQRYETIYENNDIYYRAGYYDPTAIVLNIDSDIPLLPE